MLARREAAITQTGSCARGLASAPTHCWACAPHHRRGPFFMPTFLIYRVAAVPRVRNIRIRTAETRAPWLVKYVPSGRCVARAATGRMLWRRAGGTSTPPRWTGPTSSLWPDPDFYLQYLHPGPIPIPGVRGRVALGTSC